MKRNWVIIILTGFVLLVAVFLTYRLHSANKKAVLSQFQDHQFLHAQNIAQQIESLLMSHARTLQTLSLLISLRNDSPEQKKATVRVYSDQLQKIHVEEISFYDEFGRRVHSTLRGPSGLREARSELMTWAKKRENRGKVFALTLLPDEEAGPNRPPAKDQELRSIRFLLATPLYQEIAGAIPPRPGGRFAGLLTFTIDLKEFLENQLGFVDPELNLQQVWIIDRGGTLLLQSEHQEMVLRNIRQKGESCGQCHPSFAHVEKILREREGTVAYQLRDHPKKFAAFAPMEFENASWIVVVNTTHHDMMAYAKKDLKGQLMLLGIVASVLIVSSAFISRNYRTIVSAEEEAKHWREKRSLEEKVRQSEILYRTIVETAHDIIWILDDEGHFTFANKRAEVVLGYKVSELMGKKIAPLIHPEDRLQNGTHFLKTPEDGPRHSEFRFLRNDGKSVILSVNTASLRDGNGVSGTVSFGRDITEEKEAEKALKESEKHLHYLSSQLLTAQETERRRISRELHDELGGGLAVLKLRIDLIDKNLPHDQTKLREVCLDTLSYIDQIIENVHRLTKDLSPHMLEDLGLTSALQWLIGNFARSYGIKVTCKLIEVDHLFPGNAQIIVYRMIQEALNNIGKHSGAKHITVTSEKHNGGISFWVEDDGKGFDPFKVLSKNPSEKGLGLATMNERARMLGGSVDLWSEEGEGTRIRFNIPLGREGIQE